jgi:hypothetical protein
MEARMFNMPKMPLNFSVYEANLKKEMIDDLYLQMIEFAKAANEDIRRYRLVQK